MQVARQAEPPEWTPVPPTEVQKYFKRYQKHMELDFQYNNNRRTLSPDYVRKVCLEWTQVAKIRLLPPNRNRNDTAITNHPPPTELEESHNNHHHHHHHGGFITMDGYIQISHEMEQTHGFTSWKLNTRDLYSVAQEFQAEPYMSLRRFCLYLEHEELYDEDENALRLVQPQEYYERYNNDSTTTTRTHAYDIRGDRHHNYHLYRQCCMEQLALELNYKHSQPLDWYISAFEQEDTDQTGYIDRDAILRVLYQLCSGEFVPVWWKKQQHPQPALQLLCQAIPILQQVSSLSQTKDVHNNNNHSCAIRDKAMVDEVEALLRIDCEFAQEIVTTTTKQKLTRGKNYRVSLRQFCTFVERPAYDYAIFPTCTFQEWIQHEEWSPALHGVLCRYYHNTLFQQQVITLLLISNRRDAFGQIGEDAVCHIISFLPRNFTIQFSQ